MRSKTALHSGGIQRRWGSGRRRVEVNRSSWLRAGGGGSKPPKRGGGGGTKAESMYQRLVLPGGWFGVIWRRAVLAARPPPISSGGAQGLYCTRVLMGALVLAPRAPSPPLWARGLLRGTCPAAVHCGAPVPQCTGHSHCGPSGTATLWPTLCLRHRVVDAGGWGVGVVIKADSGCISTGLYPGWSALSWGPGGGGGSKGGLGGFLGLPESGLPWCSLHFPAGAPCPLHFAGLDRSACRTEPLVSRH